MARALSLRPATAGDRRALWLLHSRSVEVLCQGAYAPHELSTWVELLRPDGYLQPEQQRTVLVAERGMSLVGFGQLDAFLGEVEALYVAPEAAGHGVGSALLGSMEALAWQQGAQMLSLDASLNAEGFYQARGYVRLHSAQRILTPLVHLACVRMRKQRPALALHRAETRGEQRGEPLRSPRPGP